MISQDRRNPIAFEALKHETPLSVYEDIEEQHEKHYGDTIELLRTRIKDVAPGRNQVKVLWGANENREMGKSFENSSLDLGIQIVWLAFCELVLDPNNNRIIQIFQGASKLEEDNKKALLCLLEEMARIHEDLENEEMGLLAENSLLYISSQQPNRLKTF